MDAGVGCFELAHFSSTLKIGILPRASRPRRCKLKSVQFLMESPAGPSHIHGTKKSESKPVLLQPQALAVAPLNSMPYIGPDVAYPLPTEAQCEAPQRVRPDVIFMPFGPMKEEGVRLTGSAAMVKAGSSFGLVDIGEFEDSYLFRVTLPGVARDERRFSCDVKPDGEISIKGVSTTGEKIVCRNFQIFKMQTQNLCPPGDFSISFQLPGPVDDQQISGGFGINGIFEGVVKKR